MYNDWVYALQKYTQKQKVSKLKPRGKNGRLSVLHPESQTSLDKSEIMFQKTIKKFQENRNQEKNKIPPRKTMLKNINKQ